MNVSIKTDGLIYRWTDCQLMKAKSNGLIPVLCYTRVKKNAMNSGNVQWITLVKFLSLTTWLK